MLCRRMAGALDLGMVLLLEPSTDRYQRFVKDHVAAPMRAAALVLRLSVAECVAEPASTPFAAIEADTEAFVAALADLSDYQSLSEGDLDAVARRLAGSVRRLTDSFRDVAERLCFEPGINREFAPERQERFGKSIADLPGVLAGERGGRSDRAACT